MSIKNKWIYDLIEEIEELQKETEKIKKRVDLLNLSLGDTKETLVQKLNHE